MHATKPTDIATELQEVGLCGGHGVEIASTDNTATRYAVVVRISLNRLDGEP